MNLKKALNIHRFMTILSVCLFVACTNTQHLQYDNYSSEWVFNGEKFNPKSTWDRMSSGTSTKAWLRGIYDEANKKEAIQLVVSSAGDGDELVVTSASDDAGTLFPTHRMENTTVQHNMFGSILYPKEQIAIDLPRKNIEAKKIKGCTIRLIGHNNHATSVDVSADYISTFLKNFDSSIALNRSKPSPLAN